MSETGTPTKSTLRAGVAEELRALLARRRISATRLARDLGWTQQYLSRRMVGDQPFDLDDLEAIASRLGVQVIELLPLHQRGYPWGASEPASPVPLPRSPLGAMSRPPGRGDPRGPSTRRTALTGR